MRYRKQDIEFDVSYDYANDENVILIDLGDRDSVVLFKDQIQAMLEELEEADGNTGS